jgi:hypothetical protein
MLEDRVADCRGKVLGQLHAVADLAQEARGFSAFITAPAPVSRIQAAS